MQAATSSDRRLAQRRQWGHGWVLLVAAVAVTAGLILPHGMIDDEPDRLDEATRSAAGSNFLRLSAGHTHYSAVINFLSR